MGQINLALLDAGYIPVHWQLHLLFGEITIVANYNYIVNDFTNSAGNISIAFVHV